MIETVDQDLIHELRNQAENPPGADLVLGSFYQAIAEMVDNGNSIAILLQRIKQSRPDITTKHFVNLLYRSYQYIKLEEGKDLSFRAFDTADKWHPELTRLLSDKQNREQLETLLLARSTSTTVYQRYAGPYALISHTFDGIPISVTDLGCGGNYGLRGIELQEPFKPICDQTPDKILSELLLRRIYFEKGLAIDKEDPDDDAVTKWRLACSFYPKELDEMTNVLAFEQRLKGSQRVQFLKTDLLTAEWLQGGVFDVAILSTILYQLNPERQQRLIDKTKKLLKPEGILIVQDFAVKQLENHQHLTFNESWSGREFGYRTFLTSALTRWNFQEVFQWMGGRCTTVRAGEDFNSVFSQAYARTSTAA
ncbi:hypothetical protein KKI19_04105 [Patescibacteria group bacterium]|nr:hypothetical protein [Patescibacteria group bacterium]